MVIRFWSGLLDTRPNRIWRRRKLRLSWDVAAEREVFCAILAHFTETRIGPCFLAHVVHLQVRFCNILLLVRKRTSKTKERLEWIFYNFARFKAHKFVRVLQRQWCCFANAVFSPWQIFRWTEFLSLKSHQITLSFRIPVPCSCPWIDYEMLIWCKEFFFFSVLVLMHSEVCRIFVHIVKLKAFERRGNNILLFRNVLKKCYSNIESPVSVLFSIIIISWDSWYKVREYEDCSANGREKMEHESDIDRHYFLLVLP